MNKLIYMGALTSMVLLSGCEFGFEGKCDGDSEFKLSVSDGKGQASCVSSSDEDEDIEDGDGGVVDEDEDEDEDDTPEIPIETGGTVVSVMLENITGQAYNGKTVTFGQVFKEGAVSSSENVKASMDGQVIPTQVNKKATWSDGSLRHAIITINVPSIAAENKKVDLKLIQEEDNMMNSGITLNQLLATDFNSNIKISFDGKNYEVDAKKILRNAMNNQSCSAWGMECKEWLSGPLASEWIVSSKVDSSNNIDVMFAVRAYSNGSGNITSARVDTIVENSQAYPDKKYGYNYSAVVTTGDNEFKTGNIKHYDQARWHQPLCWQECDGLYVKTDFNYLQDTGAISKYESLNPGREFLDGLPQDFPIMTNGNQTKSMGATGAQAAIGPLPRWTSVFVTTGDYKAFNWMLANDDAIGTYEVHYRDEETGRPLKITDHPYVTIASYSYASSAGNPDIRKDLLPKCGDRSCSNPNVFDIPHHPSTGVVAYLTTGDYYYLEEMQFVASYIELWSNYNYRGLEKGYLGHAQSQVRGQAWSLRSIADASFATPDEDPMKEYFTGIVDNIMDNYEKNLLQDDDNNLNIVLDYGAVIYKNKGTRTGIGPWQSDFFAWSFGHLADLKIERGQQFSDWASKPAIARMTNWKKDAKNGFCWINASAYSLAVRDSQNSPFYQSWDEVYAKNFGYLSEFDCNSQDFNTAFNNREGRYLEIGEMSGYGNSTTGFPSNLQPALAKAADSNLEGGKEAWKVYKDRSVKPNYDTSPNFAVVPR